MYERRTEQGEGEVRVKGRGQKCVLAVWSCAFKLSLYVKDFVCYLKLILNVSVTLMEYGKAHKLSHLRLKMLSVIAEH